MSRKLLFISKYPDIIQEFLVAMDGKEIEIDIASNGIEAATMLKKSEYQVVVTGISLDGYNGEQIITYLNKSFPNTVCIIYTTSISPAQLHFFMNERNVFRVFLRPVDFQNEFYMALEDAFGYYDVRVANEQDEASRKEDVQKKKAEGRIIHDKLVRQQQMRGLATSYMKRLTMLTLKEYSDKLDNEAKGALKELEWQAIELCFGAKEPEEEELAKAEAIGREVRGKILNIG